MVAIAAHLSQKHLGDNYGLPLLATRYKQDLQALEQVFQYIMKCLSGYRKLHGRIDALVNGGGVGGGDGGGLGAVHAALAAHEGGMCVECVCVEEDGGGGLWMWGGWAEDVCIC